MGEPDTLIILSHFFLGFSLRGKYHGIYHGKPVIKGKDGRKEGGSKGRRERGRYLDIS